MTEPMVDAVQVVDHELEGLPPGLSVQLIDGVIYFRHAGKVTLKDSLSVMARIAADPAIPPGLPLVVDLLRMILPSPSTEDIRAFVNDVGALKQQFYGKFAVVTDNTLYYGFARMISMLSEFYAITMTVFRDLESAEAFVRAD